MLSLIFAYLYQTLAFTILPLPINLQVPVAYPQQLAKIPRHTNRDHKRRIEKKGRKYLYKTLRPYPVPSPFE